MFYGDSNRSFHIRNCRSDFEVRAISSGITKVTSSEIPNLRLKSSNPFVIFLLLLSLSVPAFAGTRRFTLSPTSVSFGTVPLNTVTSKTVVITSSGTGPIIIKSVSATGQAFSMTGGPFPVTLYPGKNISVQVTFNPTSSGSAIGALTINTNSVAQPTGRVTLSGTGAGTATLGVSATSLDFGNDPVGTTASQYLTLTSTGTTAVSVSAASISGAGYSMSGATFPVTLNPGIAIKIQVSFDPSAAGAAQGGITFSSNSSTGSSTVIALTGMGIAVHQVNLSWIAPGNSPTPVVGYNVYRAPSGGSSYQQVNSTTITQTTYSDSAVTSGSSYTYYVQSVSTSGDTSVPSNQVTFTIP